MNRTQQIQYLIHVLLNEMPSYQEQAMAFPQDELFQRRLLRSLMNVRPPMPLDPSFLAVQDGLLSAEREEKGVVEADSIPDRPGHPGIAVWQGDITRLKADAIVNAANEALLGCFIPCHSCIDNIIHTCAGVQPAAGLRSPDAGPGAPRTHGPGEDHPRLQSAQPLCAAHRGSGDPGPAAGGGLPPAGWLLPVLPGAGREERPEIRCVLLYLHRRVPLPAGKGR